MALLEELETAVSTISRDVGPSVVGVGNRWGFGSGVVIASGQVLTNAHNLRREDVTITFGDGRTATGTRLGVDLDGDIAVISVDTGDTPALGWSDANGAVGVGSPVFALANPGGRGLRVTFGLVSGTQRSFRGPRGRRIAGSLEHTAPLLPGASGGPVVDARGGFIGLNTNRLGEGFYLAIPADASLKDRVEHLARGETPARPRLGVSVAPSQVANRLRRAVGLPEAEGVLVREVEDASPAASAGIQKGDLITAAGGTAITSMDHLFEAIDTLGTGKPLELTLLRGTQERTVTVAPPVIEG